ncbi:DUF6233 domain-containing protein [Streptomyces sp. GbtcB6]|uniref:DUF6233 domain-containing protein n=1 Tax=Streptomyces sp. GbtcB6 TaxID=2824751 RepID=UPI001C2FC42E|nr:DUF6233 domain-containing protein [Streptomyces sp. GbtcB6]
MSEMLPPDPARLRVILAHLDKQMADHETIGIYLRLQRDAVQAAIAKAEMQREPRVVQAPQQGPRRMKLRPGTYMLEPKIRPDHPRPAYIHIGGCSAIERLASECTIRQAELALTQDAVEAQACPACRPDMALGIEVA